MPLKFIALSPKLSPPGHQFFRCPTAKRIWQLTAGFSLQKNPKIVIWAENNWKGKGIKAVICKLGLAASDYQIW